jgi:hypothetical protein
MRGQRPRRKGGGRSAIGHSLVTVGDDAQRASVRFHERLLKRAWGSGLEARGLGLGAWDSVRKD